MTFYEALTRADDISAVSRAAAKIKPFVELIRGFRKNLQEYSIKELIEAVIEKVDYMAYLEDKDTPEAAAERRLNIDELISKATQYEEGEDFPTLSGFLEEVALVADIDNMDAENNVVSLMTLHSAKGLEFPVVYLSGMEDGLFPSYMSITEGNSGELEEERRLCYVGITRAKEKLILTAAKRRMVRGETQLNRVSRFVNEIPKEFVIVQGQSTQNSFAKTPDIFSLPPRKPGQIAFHSYQKEIINQGIFDKKSATSQELDYGEGDRVKHIKFGEGTVKSIISGGRDYEVTVEFDTAGTKKMFASFAKLTKI